MEGKQKKYQKLIDYIDNLIREGKLGPGTSCIQRMSSAKCSISADRPCARPSAFWKSRAWCAESGEAEPISAMTVGKIWRGVTGLP